KLATGVDVRQRGGFGVQTDISINGGTFDQITILLNGVNMSSPQTGHNAADFPVSLSDIERIEVLEGASARVFGSSAFNGAINIVTRTDKESSVRVSAEGGSFGTFGGDAGLSLRTGNVSQQLSGGYTQSDGGTANSDFKRRRMYYMGALESRYVNLSWQGGLSSQDYGASTFYSARFNNQWEATRRFMASALADVRPFADERLVFSPSVYWHRDVDHYQLTRGKEGAQNGENYHRMDVYGAALNAHASWLLGKTAVGVDLRKEHILSTAYGTLLDESEWTAIHGSDRHYDHRGDRTNTSVFLEHNVILGGFTLSAGVLANRNTGLDNRFRFYPGVDISYRPSDNWKFYASWNKALRVPTFTDLYTSNSAQQGDPNLSPERNSTFKIGTRFRTRGVEAVLSGFYSEGKNIIDWVYPTAESRKYQAMNIGKLDNMGYSADVTLNMDELVPGSFITRVKAGYAFIHQKHETDREIFGSLYALEYLRHKATFQLDHRIWSRLSASWAVRWQQRMNNYSPYTKVDVKLMWTAPSYSLYVKADNITCHRYYDLGAVRQPGLWIMAGGSVRIGL
uniref:TonB-dependent receptor n=1 Tax=Prevotella sp. TaxID=59823 RepID=UPI00307C73A9